MTDEEVWKDKIDRARGGEDVQFTPDEIDFMIEENEDFRGKMVDVKKIQQWNTLLSLIFAFKDRSNCCLDIALSPPERNKRHAIAALHIKSYSVFSRDEMVNLNEVGLMADRVSYSALSDDDIITIGFHVTEVWSK